MCRLRIIEVIFLEDYKMNIALSNGHGILYDISPKLKTARFQTLQPASVFCSGQLSQDSMICWPDGTELSLDEILLELANKIPYRITKE